MSTTLLYVAPVWADDSHLENYDRPFNGSFTEFSLRGGPSVASIADDLGWTLDAGFRNSFPFYLGDNRVSYRYGNFSVDDRSLQLHGIHAALAIHPFYLAILSRGLISHFLASLHIEGGFGGQWGSLSGDEISEPSSAFGVVGTLGAGFDLPLTDANAGQALWFNALYRRTWSSLSYTIDDERQRASDHGFFLGLAWRINGTIW